MRLVRTQPRDVTAAASTTDEAPKASDNRGQLSDNHASKTPATSDAGTIQQLREILMISKARQPNIRWNASYATVQSDHTEQRKF